MGLGYVKGVTPDDIRQGANTLLGRLGISPPIHGTMALSSLVRTGFMGGKQLGHRFAEGFAYGDYEQSTPKKRTKREKFLAEMEAVVPWQSLIDLIEPHYPKSSSKGGRPAYPPASMLRIHLMQQWYSLSDPAMEDALIEAPIMRRFAGIDMISERIPDETTILAFRHLLKKHNLGEKIFQAVNAHLKDRGMAIKKFTIIDASWIAAPRSTKNQAWERDPEMHQTKKGNQWYYGMNVHIGVDKDSGLIHSAETTAATVDDLTPAAELLHGGEDVLYAVAAGFCEAVAGYQGIEKRPDMEGKTTTFRIAMRPGERRALSNTAEGRQDDLVETAKARIRAEGEHPFPRDQAAVRISENSPAGHGQESLQGQRAGCAYQSVPCASSVAM